MSLKNKGNIKTFPNIQMLRDFITTKSLEKNVKGVFQAERMLINSTKTYKCVKLTRKGKYIGKDRFSNIVMVMCKSLTILV